MTGNVSGTCAAERLRRGASGQAATETVFAIGFVLALMLAIVYLSLLVSARHMVNYAAFAGARAAMYSATDWRISGQTGHDRQAAGAVLDMFYWGRPPRTGATSRGFRVEYPTPFALPLFHQDGGNVVVVTSVVPIPRQMEIPEVGDNAER